MNYINRITADTYTLLKQSKITTEEHYFLDAIKVIDEKFGEGYAKQHPELISMFMQIAQKDFNHAILVQTIQQIGEAIDDELAILQQEINEVANVIKEN